MQAHDLSRLVPRYWGPAFELAFTLSLGDAFALAFQHDLTFPGGNAGQDGEHQLAGGIAGVQTFATHAEDNQANAALRQVRLDRQQLSSAACETIRLRDNECITLADEVEASLQLVPLRHAGHLFSKHLLASDSLQVAFLCLKSGLLILGACPGVSDQHWEPRHVSLPLDYKKHAFQKSTLDSCETRSS